MKIYQNKCVQFLQDKNVYRLLRLKMFIACLTILRVAGVTELRSYYAAYL